MYKVTREFNFPAGHVLALHEGKCHNIHGHGWRILVTLTSEKLNDNYMIMDFGDLKQVVNKVIGPLDHAFFIDENQIDKLNSITKTNLIYLVTIPGEPTSENLARYLFYEIKAELCNFINHYPKKVPNEFIYLDSITVYENDKSSSTYSES